MVGRYSAVGWSTSAWAVVLLVLLAGCTGGSTGGGPPPADGPTATTPPPTTTRADSPSATVERTTSTLAEDHRSAETPAGDMVADSAAEEPTEPGTEERPAPAEAANPWGREPVVVGVDGSQAPDRRYAAQVRRAATYWEANATADVAWTPAFEVDPDSSEPDVTVRFVDRIERCGREDESETIGCARLLAADSTPRDPEVVRIVLGLTNESTYRTVRHELGHVLGLQHGQGPGDVMAPYGRVYDDVVRVYVEYDTTATYDRRVTRDQVRHALDYYAEGAGGHLEEDVAFAIVEERPGADVVVEFEEHGDRSTASVEDGVTVVRVEGIALDRRGWHVGYWLGYYFGASSPDELPPPFDEPGADPRERWWG